MTQDGQLDLSKRKVTFVLLDQARDLVLSHASLWNRTSQAGAEFLKPL